MVTDDLRKQYREAKTAPVTGFLFRHYHPVLSFTLGMIKRSVSSPQDGCTGGSILREYRNAN